MFCPEATRTDVCESATCVPEPLQRSSVIGAGEPKGPGVPDAEKIEQEMKSTLKRFLPERFSGWIRRGLQRLDMAMVAVASGNGYAAGLYYLVFSRTFRREHRAVLLGRLNYWKGHGLGRDTHYQLRRNTHRIEKGLIMRPRRSLFAADYIAETVKCYRTAIATPDVCRDEVAWAGDVLAKYFEAVETTPVVAAAREEFEATRPRAEPERFPYPHAHLPAPSIGIEDFERLCIRRRSVRWFSGVAVQPDLIEKVVKVASLAPSACNRQPFAFYVVYGQQAGKLASLAGGAGGFSDNIPCCIAVVGELSAYPYERDRHLIYIDGALASMQFMLACETTGLATCPINWPDEEAKNRRIQQFLKLEDFQHTVMLIGVGYPDPEGGVPYSAKRSTDKLIRAC